jgi:hypothetical protein
MTSPTHSDGPNSSRFDSLIVSGANSSSTTGKAGTLNTDSALET